MRRASFVTRPPYSCTEHHSCIATLMTEEAQNEPQEPDPDVQASALVDPADDHGLRNIGLWVTIPWLVGTVLYVVFKWQAFVALEPNSLGDFLAGAFAPLAFLWLVLGFLQQGKELRFSGRALTLQSVELANSVAQQAALVRVTRDQLSLENSVIARQEAELQRSAQPLLRFKPGASYPGDAGLRNFDFTLSNVGKKCTDLFVFFDDMEDGTEFAMLDTGKSVSVTRQFPSMGYVSFVVTVSYMDDRMMSGHREWRVERTVETWTTTPVIDAEVVSVGAKIS